MLNTLSFDVNVPTILFFLNRFIKVAECNSKQCHFASYLAELTLLDTKMNKWAPSRIAAAATYVSLKILDKSEGSKWSILMTQQTGYDENKTR